MWLVVFVVPMLYMIVIEIGLLKFAEIDFSSIFRMKFLQRIITIFTERPHVLCKEKCPF
jgi:hypothetical protein